MRKLKSGGRCGMVVPNGTLFATGVGERIKKDLLENFNLHTIVRLPKGVFAPYTDIETNLLFFDKDGPTQEIWYYEHPLPPARQKLKNPCYTKTKPLQYEEFKPLQKWWNTRVKNEHAWNVPVEDIMNNNCNLDIRNPQKNKPIKFRPLEEIVASIISKEKRILDLMQEVQMKLSGE